MLLYTNRSKYIFCVYYIGTITCIPNFGMHVSKKCVLRKTSMNIPKKIIQNICIFEHVSMVSCKLILVTDILKVFVTSIDWSQ